MLKVVTDLCAISLLGLSQNAQIFAKKCFQEFPKLITYYALQMSY